MQLLPCLSVNSNSLICVWLSIETLKSFFAFFCVENCERRHHVAQVCFRIRVHLLLGFRKHARMLQRSLQRGWSTSLQPAAVDCHRADSGCSCCSQHSLDVVSGDCNETQRSDISSVKLKFHLARHVTSRHDTIRSTCRPMHFGYVELVEHHDSTRSARIARLARHVERVVSCRDVTWRAKVEFGLNSF